MLINTLNSLTLLSLIMITLFKDRITNPTSLRHKIKAISFNRQILYIIKMKFNNKPRWSIQINNNIKNWIVPKVLIKRKGTRGKCISQTKEPAIILKISINLFWKNKRNLKISICSKVISIDRMLTGPGLNTMAV